MKNNKSCFLSHFDSKWLYTKYLFRNTCDCHLDPFMKLIARFSNLILWAFIKYDVSYYLTLVSIAFQEKMWRTQSDAATCIYEPQYRNDCAVSARKYDASLARRVKTNPKAARCLNINTYYEISKIIIIFLIFFNE